MINKKQNNSKWLNIWLLLGWVTLGIALRFTNLGDKSASSIEISTLGFSLGNGFLAVPLDRVISLDTLLLPLAEADTIPQTVITRLMSESNHPPFYFLLTHLWLKVITVGDILEKGRSLSALFGVATIPAMFAFALFAFRSLLVAHIAAALMAVSPYGIYLAQEARHYTLTILWIIASLCCLVAAARCLENQKNLPVWVGLVWVMVNSLGIATHYFFSLVLCVEALVMGGLWLRDFRLKPRDVAALRDVAAQRLYWLRIFAVAAGTAIGCLVWFTVIFGISGQELTDWIETSYTLNEIWTPIPRLLAWWITMFFLLPVEGTPLPVTICSSLIILLVWVWVAPGVINGLKIQITSPNSRLSMLVLLGFWLGAIALFLFLIYAFGKDVSLAARYHFVYFPVMIILLAAALAICWQETKSKLTFSFPARGKQVVIVILLMGFLGGITVITNSGYQKSQQADLLVSQIQNNSQVPSLIAMTYKTHAELRSLIALGFEFQRQQLKPPQFILLDKNNYAGLETSPVLVETLKKIERPFDLWGVNLNADSDDLEALNCPKSHVKVKNYGYRVKFYNCEY